jgi:hypothetical protein
MTTKLLPGDVLAAHEPATSFPSRLKSIGARMRAWAGACAAYWEAAALYEQLSALSDAELARRSLSRSTLAHDVRAACERDAQP